MMNRIFSFCRGFVFLASLIAAQAAALASENCRIAFDMGSSGIRAGTTGNDFTTRADIDYLGPLWAGQGIAATLPATLAALRQLPIAAGFPADCEQVGGGFSAWRLALQQEPAGLVVALEQIRTATGVAVVVLPQQAEGSYGYFGARQLLGEKLVTSHVLDIGGGSLQVSGLASAFGEAMGQKIWQRFLCQEIRGSESSPCQLQPMSQEELAKARRLADARLAGASSVLATPLSMTAISRPVSRGVLPALLRLADGDVSRQGFSRRSLSVGIEKLALLSSDETAELVASSPPFVSYLLSDMLLVEGLLRVTGGDYLQVAELDLTNLPGLLADDRAYAWGRHYNCYLERLRSLGLAAYESDPASCP